MKIDEKAKQYADETRMFQRIAGVPETSEEELINDYKQLTKPRRERALQSIIDHNIIARMARKAGEQRNN